MDESPKGSGERRFLLIVGLVGLALVGIVIFVTSTMVGSDGGRPAFTQASGTSERRAEARPRRPVAQTLAQAPIPVASPGPTRSPETPSPKPSASPAATRSPKSSPSPRASVSARPSDSARPIAKNRTAPPARAVQVATLSRRESPAAQPLGPVPSGPPQQPPLEPPTFPPTPSPSPPAAPKLEDARILRATVPELDDNSRASVNLPATVVVNVTVGPNGRATAVRLERSGGSIYVDREALSAARSTIYAPAKVDGKPTTSTYRAVYEFR